MDDVRRLLFFRPFSPEVLQGVAATARWRSYEAGQVVLEAGDPSHEVFFIAEGEVRVISRSSGGQEIILNELRSGGFFGEISAIDEGDRSAGIIALTRARICAVPANPFMEFALSTPEASRHLMRALAGLVREKDERLLEFAVLPLRPRLAALLLRLSRPRDGGGRIVSPPRPHHELAARLGTRREVVSRLVSAMKREGLLEVLRVGVVLPRPEALREEVEAAFAAG